MILKKMYFKKYKHFLACTIFIFLILWFHYLKETIVPIYIMHSSFDDKIPFIKEFIIAYYAWFLYMVVGFIYLGLVSKKDFYRLLAFLTLNMTLCFIIYILFPNGQFPRPIVSGNDIFSILVKFVYSVDATNNVCPSIHVANAIGVHIALINCSKLKRSHSIKAASFIAMVLISASTVFVKQHSILDVYAGIFLSIIIYISIYQLPKIFATKNVDKDITFTS